MGPNDPPVKRTREHSAPKQLWPNRGRHNAFPLLGLGGKGALVACTAQMSLRSDCPRRYWLRHSDMICDQRPCFAGAEKW